MREGKDTPHAPKEDRGAPVPQSVVSSKDQVAHRADEKYRKDEKTPKRGRGRRR